MDALTATETASGGIEALYRAQGKRLWWSLLAYSGDPEVASDAVAEAFARALHAGGSVRDPARWVWRVAFRVAADELRRRRRFGPPVEGAYELDDRAQAVLTALAGLSPKQRAAVVLHYYAGYTAAETGDLIGSAAATVAVHLHRARRRLRELLQEDDGWTR